jgi:phosphopantothenoylcysteine synthetase/decarboxylase
MLDVIEKQEKRIRTLQRMDTRDAMLQVVLPMFKKLYKHYELVFGAIDKNFRDIWQTLHIGEEHTTFLDFTEKHVTDLHGLVDEIMLAAGFFASNPNGEGFVPTESMPTSIHERIVAMQQQAAEWFIQLEAVRVETEEALDDMDDDEDYDEDEDEDEDEDYDEDEDEDEDEELEATDDSLPQISRSEPAEKPVVEEPVKGAEDANA